MKMKPIKMFTVIWTDKAKNIYGVEKDECPIISLDTDEIKVDVSTSKVGRPKIRIATVYPFFETKKEADSYRGDNPDFQTVKVTTLIYKP